ncbi:MAG: hypothetical protein ACRD0N_12920 [Acidimicrobiales bacterium]
MGAADASSSQNPATPELVESLASAWGVESSGGGKTVWFEVDRPDVVAREGQASPL